MDPQSRQEYVRAAISFLQNPKLVESPLKEKLRFLKDKGLSDVEVDEALNLALVNRNQSQGGKWNFLLMLGVCVGGYKLYQAYLEQKAAQASAKPQEKGQIRVNDSQRLTARNNAWSQDGPGLDQHQHQPTLTDILQKLAELKTLVELQRNNFGTEIQSLKTLMLGHEKFAAPPKIPDWQMASADNNNATKETTSEAAVKPEKSSKKGQGEKSRTRRTETTKQSQVTNGIIEPAPLVGPNLE